MLGFRCCWRCWRDAAPLWFSAPTCSDAELPRVAMIIAAYNEADVLPAKLANTWAIDYPADKFTLLIGSDGSADATPEILRDCDDSRLQAHCFSRRRGKISVLNDLVARAGADILVMSGRQHHVRPGRRSPARRAVR